MNRKRKWTDEKFIEAVREMCSISGVLKRIGLKATGANYKTVHSHVRRLNLDTSHWLGQAHMRGKQPNHVFMKRSLSEILVEESDYDNTSSLKRRLLNVGLLKNECTICGQESEWKGQPLVMVLDHINGVNNDNRLDNLRLLCPNCNSQQTTFCRGKKRDLRNLVCSVCGKKITFQSKTGKCPKCARGYTAVAQLAGGVSLKN